MNKKKVLIIGGLALCMGIVGCSDKVKDKVAGKTEKNEFVEISKYKGIEVEKPETEKVTDDEVEERINQVLQNNRTKKEISGRGIESGDVVTIDYQIVNGEEIVEEGYEAEVEMGSSTFVEGVEEGLLGHAAGEEFDIPVTFPVDYGNEILNGASMIFHVKVNSVSEKNLPTLDDDFVKKVTDDKCKSVEDYRKQVKKDLQKEKEEAVQSELQTKVWNEVLKNVKVLKYPEKKLQENVSAIQNAYSQSGQEGEELGEAQATELAQNALKEELAYEFIAEKEKLTLSDEEKEKELDKLAKEYGYKDLETLKQAGAEEQIKIFEQQIVRERVLEWLVEHSKIK